MSRRGRPGSPVRFLALDIDARNLVGHDYGGVRRLAILNSRSHCTFVPAWYAVFSLMGAARAQPTLDEKQGREREHEQGQRGAPGLAHAPEERHRRWWRAPGPS